MDSSKLLIALLFFASCPDLSGQESFYTRLSAAAIDLINPHVVYHPSYVKLPYPGGDLPPDKGVCTDVVIRAYRKLGIDLQKELHEDMKKHFSLYPQLWGMKHTDTNIDHRRVPNLMKFFSRKGHLLPMTENEKDYHPGDIVCWILKSGQTHIGIVVDRKVTSTDRYELVHNIGYGQVAEDCLFHFKIIGHYRYQK